MSEYIVIEDILKEERVELCRSRESLCSKKVFSVIFQQPKPQLNKSAPEKEEKWPLVASIRSC